MEIKTNTFNQPQVITRKGDAPAVPEEREVNIQGTLKAPADYLLNKVSKDVMILRLSHSNEGYQEIHSPMYFVKDSVLKVCKTERKLTLHLNMKNYVEDKIEGVLQMNQIWSDLRVNTGSTWGISELRKYLKRIKFFFTKPEQHSEFLAKLQNFVGKVESNYKDIQKSGEYENSTAHKLMEGQVIPEFKIDAPIYVGYEKKTVRVEVFADMSDGGVKFQLESQDLFTLQEELSEEYIDAEIERIEKMCENEISVVNIN